MKKTFLFSLLISLVTCATMYASTNEILRVDFESDSIPAGWTQEVVQMPIVTDADPASYTWHVESGDSLIYPNGCVSGTHRAYARNATSGEMRFVTRLISPTFSTRDLPTTPQLLFSHAEVRRMGNSDTLKVYYRTSALDYWHLIPNAVYARNALWQNEVINLIGSSENYQIAFEIVENMGRGVVLDDIVVRTQPTCMDASNIVASSVHAYDAFVSWDANGAYNEFEVILADTVLDVENIDQAHVVQYITSGIYNPEISLSSLQPDTKYYVYVRSDCSESLSGFTNWVGGSFRTLKVAYLPYTQNFNSTIASSISSAYGVPDGWTVGSDIEGQVLPFVLRNASVTERVAHSIDSTTFLAFEGETSAAHTPIPARENVYAVTPQIVVGSLDSVELSFWATAYNFISLGSAQYAARLQVGAMTDPADFRTFVPVDTIELTTSYQFRRFNVSFRNYTGNGKFIAIVSNELKANAVYVDNVTLRRADCFTPTHTHLTGVNADGLTVETDLNGADSWNVMVSKEYSRTGAVSAESVLFQQTGLTAPSYRINANLADSIVCVYVQGVKNGVASPWTFPITIRVPGRMPEVTEETPFRLSFEAGSSDLQITKLANELRLATTLKGLSQVYYPLGAIDNTINTYPKNSSLAPNYEGAHAVLQGADSWFFLPETQNLNQLKMVFRHQSNANTYGKLAVGVMTDPYDLNTFEQVSVFEADGTGLTYNRCLVSFDQYTGSGRYIAFRSLDAGSGEAASVNLIDEVTVSLLGTCREPSNVSLSVHSTYATANWNGGGMDGWIVGLSKIHSMMNATYDTIYTPSYTFTNLDQETKYYVTIQSICGDSLLDLDDVIYNFTTPRGLPFVENFSSSLPKGWTSTTGLASSIFAGQPFGTGTGWSFISSSSYVFAPQSGYAAYVNIYGSSCNKWLLTPVLYLDAEDDQPLELNFVLGMHGYNGSTQAGPDDKFMVVVSQDGGNSWRAANATVWSNDGKGDYVLNDLYWEGAQSFSVDLSAYKGKRIQIGFYAESTVSNADNYVSLDNVEIRIADPSCGGLSALTGTGTSSTTATVSWQLAGVNPKPAIVQLSKSANFNTILSTDTIQGNTLSYQDLDGSTLYYIRARQACQNDSEWKNATFTTRCDMITVDELGVEDFTATSALLCWSTGFRTDKGNGTAPDRYVPTAFGPVLRIQKAETGADASDGAYAISPELAVGDTINKYQVIFSACTYSSSATNVHRVAVGVVTDPSNVGYTYEQIATVSLENAKDSTEMKTYIVSLEDYIGDIEENMGHYIMFSAMAGQDSTDYVYIDKVSLEPAMGCHQVINLKVKKEKVDGAEMFWSGNGVDYELAVSDKPVVPDTVTAGNWAFYTVTADTFLTVSGLNASTNYYAYIRAHCGDDDYSHWSSATRLRTCIGAPYLETFDEMSALSSSDWSIYSGSFGADSTKTANLSSTSYGWSLIDVPSNVKGLANKMIRMNIYSTSKYWAVSPAIDLSTAGESELTFSLRAALCAYSGGGTPGSATTPDDRIGLLVSTDGGATWYAKDATFFSADGSNLGLTAKRLTADLTNYSGQTVRLAVYGESTASNVDNYLMIDSVRIEKRDAVCLGVRNATFVLDTDTSAVARWTVFGTPKEVEVSLSQDPDFISVLRTDTTTEDSIALGDLVFNSSYYVRLRQVGCIATPVVLNVHTPYAAPFTETFDRTALPVDWTVMSGNADSAIISGILPQEITSTQVWKFKSGAGFTDNHLFGELYSGSIPNRKWLVSPEIVIPASLEKAGLVFDMALTKHNASTAPTNTDGNQFRVLVSTDGGATWLPNQWLFANEPDAYRQLSSIAVDGETITLDFSEFIGSRIRFAFYKESTGSNDNDVHIRNVQLRPVGEPCDDPTNLVADSISFTTVRLSWQGQEDKTSIIEYALSADFSGARVDSIASGLTYTLTNLRPATTYYARVMQICGENSISGYSAPVAFKTSLGLPYEEAFQKLGDWTRYSQASVTDLDAPRTTTNSGWKENGTLAILGVNHIYCANSSSTTYWLISPEVDLTPDTNAVGIVLDVDLSLTQSYSKSNSPTATGWNTANRFYIMASVDDGLTFPDSLRTTFAPTGGNFDYTKIPCGLGDTYSIDYTRLAGHKVRFALVSQATKGAAINVANFHLYAIGSRCFGVTDAVVGQVDTAAVVTIVPGDIAHLWEYACVESGQSLLTATTHLSDTTCIKAGGLSLNSVYDFYVRSICAEGDTSAWAGPFTFTTPQGLTYTNDLSSQTGWSRYTANPDSVFVGRDSLKTTTYGWNTTTQKAILGQAHSYCSKDINSSFWLVSPAINMMPQDGSRGIWLSFDAALTSGPSTTSAPASTVGNRFFVAASTDDGKTWQQVAVWGEDTATVDYFYKDIPNGNGRPYHLDMTSFHGQTVRIAFVEAAAKLGTSCIHLANVELAEYAVPCFGLASAKVEILGNQAHCVLEPTDSAHVWQYAYGKDTYVPVEADAKTVNSTDFYVNNLPMSTTFQFYFRSLCGDADTSAWSGPYTVKTAKGVRYEEPMNWSSIDSEWKRYTYSNTSGTFTEGTSSYPWQAGTCSNYGFSGNHSYIEVWSTYSSMLASPEIDLGNINATVELSFDLALTGYYTSGGAPTSVAGQDFRVLVSTDNGATWHFNEPVALWGQDDDADADYIYADIPASGDRYTVDMSDYMGEKIRVGFMTHSTGGSDNYLHLRNLVLDSVPSGTCPFVRRISVRDTTYHEATITFRGNRLNEAIAFDYVCIPRGSIFNARNAVRVDTNFVVIKGLQSSSNYEIYARALCSDSTTWSDWAGPFDFHTITCEGVTNATASNVTLNEFDLKISAPNAAAASGYMVCIVDRDDVLDPSLAFFSATANLHVVKSMSLNAEYDVYACKVCQPGDTSEWAGPFILRAPYGIRYEEPMSWTSVADDWAVQSGLTGTSTSYYSWSTGMPGVGFDESHPYLNMYGYSGYYSDEITRSLLKSPVVDLSNVPVGTPIYATFDMALTGYNSGTLPTSTDYASFYVIVSDDNTWRTSGNGVWKWGHSASDYAQLSSIPTEGEQVELDLSAYAGRAIRMGFYGFCSEGSSSCYVHLHNLSIDTVTTSATCPGIDQLTLSNIGLQGADVMITYKDESDPAANTAFIEVATDDQFLNVVLTDTIKNQPVYSIVGLNASTTYYVHVRRVCSEFDESPWSKRATFTTSFGVRFFEDFDESTRFSKNWTRSDVSASSVFNGGKLSTTGTNWSIKTGHTVSMPTPHLQMNVWSSSKYGWVVTPAIDLRPNAGDGVSLSFDLAWAKYNNDAAPAAAPDDQFMVIVSTDGGDTWSRQNTFVWADTTSRQTHDYNMNDLGVQPTHYMLDFTRFTGHIIKVAFYAESVTSNGDNDMLIDNVDLNFVHTFNYSDTICQFEDYAEHGFYYSADDLQLGDNDYRIVSANQDTITNLHIYVAEQPIVSVQGVVCEGERYTGYGFDLTVTKTDTYRRAVETAVGCDSIYELFLTVLPIERVEVEDTIYDGESIVIGGIAYYTESIVVDTTTSVVTGCDSILTHYITVLPMPQGWTNTYRKDRMVQKVFIDGRMFIIIDDRWYDTTGRLMKGLPSKE